MLPILLLVMDRLNTAESAYFISLVYSLLLKDLTRFYLRFWFLDHFLAHLMSTKCSW